MKTAFRIAVLLFSTACLLLPNSLWAEVIRQTTNNNAFIIEMTPPEGGFTIGKNELNLRILNAEKKEVHGAAVDVKPWMPSMGHGVLLEPTIMPGTGGRYDVENVGISMPGHWQLIVSVKTDSEADQTIFEFPDLPGGTDSVCNCGPGCKCENCASGKGSGNCSAEKTDCSCCPKCQCEHCKTGKETCACKAGKNGCDCGPNCQCEHCKTGKGTCACKAEKNGCDCGPNCQCEHCKTGKGACACKAGKETCACKAEKNGCDCGPNCQCEHCKTGNGACACKR